MKSMYSSHSSVSKANFRYILSVISLLMQPDENDFHHEMNSKNDKSQIIIGSTIIHIKRAFNLF